MKLALQITVTILISFTSGVLACAEAEDPSGSWRGLLTIPIALAALVFVDHLRWVKLPLHVVTGLGLLAFYVAANEFIGGGLIESRLLAASHLLLYLGWLYLVQEKSSRHYWWLHALGALQLALASVLTSRPWFGVALLAAAFLGSWSLSLLLVVHSTAGSLDGDATDKPPVPDPEGALGTVRTEVAYDDGHQLINWRFVGNSLLLTALSLVFSVAFFVFTPRIWLGPAATAGDGYSSSLVGFSESVRLGDMGTALENEEPALEVRIFDLREQRYLTEEETLAHLGEEPLFRGAVLEIYADGRWERSPDRGYQLPRYEDLSVELQQLLRYRQDIKLHGMGSSLLFTHGQILTVESERGMKLSREFWSGEIQLSQKVWFGGTNYRAYEFDAPTQYLHEILRQRPRSRFGDQVDKLTLTPTNTERIYDLAVELLATGREIPTIDEAVRIVERHFQESGQYSYTLQKKVVDRNIDPVVDFLFNRREGHCEYFASAMALVLRKAGIPARVVTGFKGGAWDQRRNAFVVQQLHAHAWVEAYVRDTWVTADPTPPARNSQVQSSQGNAPEKMSWRSTLTNLWSMSVQMTKSQQDASIYEPTMALATAVTQDLPRPDEFISQWRQFVRSPGSGLSVGSTLISLVLAAMIVGLGYGLLYLLRRLGLRRGASEQAEQRIRVEFYERFIELLRKLGYKRKPHQTPKEFADEVTRQLAPRLESLGLTEQPGKLVGSFYEVRFGQHPIGATELKRLNEQLDQLEYLLNQPPRAVQPA